MRRNRDLPATDGRLAAMLRHRLLMRLELGGLAHRTALLSWKLGGVEIEINRLKREMRKRAKGRRN